MNRIAASVSSVLFDIEGDILIKAAELVTGSALSDIARRATRTATLDGGASLFDTGYSSSDKTITLRMPWNSAADALREMIKKYSTVVLVTADGAYIANPYSFAQVNENVVITLNVISDA